MLRRLIQLILSRFGPDYHEEIIAQYPRKEEKVK